MSKTRTATLQIVMSYREIELLDRLARQLGVTKSQILVECSRLAVEAS